MTLPSTFTPVPFSAARGIPQTAPFEQYQITIAASSSDLPAILQTPPTEVIFDANNKGMAPRSEVPEDERDLFTKPVPMTLEVLHPIILVRNNENIIGSRFARPKRPMKFGVTEEGSLAIEIWIDELSLTAGSLRQPGDVGASILVGARLLTRGLDRIELPASPKEEDLYGLLR